MSKEHDVVSVSEIKACDRVWMHRKGRPFGWHKVTNVTATTSPDGDVWVLSIGGIPGPRTFRASSRLRRQKPRLTDAERRARDYQTFAARPKH
jgi:hypothetical protein